MKCAIVPMSAIAASGGRLDAGFYCNPEGGEIDQEIARRTRSIKLNERAIQDLKGRKVEIIERRKRLGIKDIA